MTWKSRINYFYSRHFFRYCRLKSFPQKTKGFFFLEDQYVFLKETRKITSNGRSFHFFINHLKSFVKYPKVFSQKTQGQSQKPQGSSHHNRTPKSLLQRDQKAFTQKTKRASYSRLESLRNENQKTYREMNEMYCKRSESVLVWKTSKGSSYEGLLI